MAMRYDAATLREWIDQVNEEGKNLTKWETDFMESVSEQFAEKPFLSDGQIQILENIYVKRVK